MWVLHKHIPGDMPRATTKKKRKLDPDETLQKYILRLRGLPDDAFAELDGAWVSTFKIYGTLAWPFDYVPPRMRCNATELVAEAASRGVDVRGVTSQRKKKGAYICNKLPAPDGTEVDRDTCRTVYVGQFSYFTGNKKHPVFSILPCDKAYITCVTPVAVADAGATTT